MNIVFSTTRQWNPGDELIFRGVKNLIPEKHIFIVYNRHPFLERKQNGDNSYALGIGDEIIDHVIFAGSPEYHSEASEDLYNLIENQKVPFSYIGVGGKPLTAGRPYSKAVISIGRDLKAGDLPGSKVLPCPAILANKNFDLKIKTKKEKIGFVFQSNEKYICSVSTELYFDTVEYINKYKPLVICHNYMDYVKAYCHGWKPFYSSDPLDYDKVYSSLDLVISTRIHGSGWAANYAVPSVTIAHDWRAQTAENFGSILSNGKVLDLEEKVDNLNIEKKSKELIQLRKDTLGKYLELTVPVFGSPEWIL